MTAHDITIYLQDNEHGTFGTDLFTDDMPDTPDDLIVIHEYTGPVPLWTRDSGTPVIDYPRLQLVVRGTSYTDVHNRATAAHAQLLLVANADIDGVRRHHVWPLGSGWLKDRDDRGRFVWKRNYQVQQEAITQGV